MDDEELDDPVDELKYGHLYFILGEPDEGYYMLERRDKQLKLIAQLGDLLCYRLCK